MPILADTEQAAQKRAAELDGLAPAKGNVASAARFVGAPEQFATWMDDWHAAQACDGFDILPAVLPLDLDPIVDVVVPQLRRLGLRQAGYESTTLRGMLGLQRSASRFAA